MVFYINGSLEVKFTARFRKMYNSKTKKPLDSMRRQKCDADFKGFSFSCLGKVKDSPLALRAYISLEKTFYYRIIQYNMAPKTEVSIKTRILTSR